MKKAIRYLRFSSDDQSQHSIERQDLVTTTWMKQHDVFLTDTFKDEGYSAKNFDRPDIKELFSFIQRNFRQIDYLVVSELTRFSRDAGEALSTLKEIQKNITSASLVPALTAYMISMIAVLIFLWALSSCSAPQKI